MALTPFKSQLLADVGISMGDEGKGRVVYELIAELKESSKLAKPVAAVLKVNGGANSGHTAGGLKLNLLPAGVIDPDIDLLAIGMGVVADPRKFWWEAKPLEAAGYDVVSRLAIDERTQVSDLCHRLLDLAWESYRSNILGEAPRGSTGRGITPAYLDEVGQMQIGYAEFRGSRESYARRLAARADRAVRTIQHVCQVSPQEWHQFFETLTTAETRANQASIDEGIFPASEFDFTRFRGEKPFTLNLDALTDAYWEAGSLLADRVMDLRERLLAELRDGRSIIGEFGQSYWLDKRHGFAPNVTASHTYSPEFFQSAGFPVQPVHTVGCCKAYDTKVGTHIFLTQFPDKHPLGERLKLLEFGTSTGRQRMVGWFDAVEKGDALRFGGYEDIVLNKLDALTSAPGEDGKLLVCTHYRDQDGKSYCEVPRDDRVRRALQPVYAELPAWKEDISGVRSFAGLPANAQRYVAFCVKSLLAVAERNGHRIEKPNLRYIGVGPDTSQIIRDVPTTSELLKLA
ncbi:adenylosuccinate synthetase [Ruficoccus amylovorans]|uniref:Adenylosuccinate synthetase n=1 Tax=Ruficoccus amylovorans TaxID=1804625 RepID=A0A842HGP5_9BACT|nr:adenylosuccinate synthetase [Ruficoccus amylovorans]MBC2595592.1 adenylosuccinate synthetase [Ruficoccus amylovorans]